MKIKIEVDTFNSGEKFILTSRNGYQWSALHPMTLMEMQNLVDFLDGYLAGMNSIDTDEVIDG